MAVPGQVRAVPEPRDGQSEIQCFSMSPELSLTLGCPRGTLGNGVRTRAV
jgi:hypothetical protein